MQIDFRPAWDVVINVVQCGDEYVATLEGSAGTGVGATQDEAVGQLVMSMSVVVESA